MAVRNLLLCGLAVASAAISSPVAAQQVGANAVRAADDAFGSSVGNESVGLYSPYFVRGFSPFSAGNVRLEGLYYDPAASFNGRLIRGSTVRVGLSAQGYPFPAPTGIGDFRLRLPGDHPAASIYSSIDDWGGTYFQFDGQTPIVGDRLAAAGGFHVSSDHYRFGGGGVHASGAAIVRIQPTDTLEVIPFTSVYRHFGMDNAPILIPATQVLPPRIERNKYFSQKWARYKGYDYNSGVITRWREGPWQLQGGLFRSISTTRDTFTELFTDMDSAGYAQHHLVAGSPAQKYASTSGEIRASGIVADGPRAHELILALRARDRTRRYGGGGVVDLGPTQVIATPVLPKPEFHFGSQTQDEVRQWSGGIGYYGNWRGVGELTLGAQKVNYRKATVRPSGPAPISRSNPILYNGALAVTAVPRTVLYAGFTRGLEESASAPSYAANRDEAPPAIMTRQYDAGLRYNLSKDLKLVAGLFDVQKPYFGIDDQNIYRKLGKIRNRGAELSLSGTITPRLTLLAGAVLLKSRISGDDVNSGIVGPLPVGSYPSRLLLSLDYDLPIKGLSVNTTIYRFGRQPANRANTLFVEPYSTLDLALRYATTVADRPLSVRLLASNLLNVYQPDIVDSGAFYFIGARELTLMLSTDL